jgi:hypothetical protein
MVSRVRRAGAALAASAFVLVAMAAQAAAAPVPPRTAPPASLPPNPGPNAGIPGSGLITELLGWLKYGALASAVVGLLVGGIATGVGYSSANFGASAAGRRFLMGGLAAAVIAGLAHSVAIALYRAT